MDNASKVAAPSHDEQTGRNRYHQYLSQCVVQTDEMTYQTFVYAIVGSSDMPRVMNMVSTFHAVSRRIHHIVVPVQSA